MNLHLLGDAYDHMPWELAKQIFFLLAALLTIGVLALTFWALLSARFGRKPPIEENMRSYSATLEQFKLDLAKLPDEEKFNKLAEQLAGFASLKQLAALEIAMDRQIKDVSRGAHDSYHAVRNELNPRLLELETDRIIRGERLAAVEADMRSLKHLIDQVNEKIDKQSDRTIERILEIWRKERQS